MPLPNLPRLGRASLPSVRTTSPPRGRKKRVDFNYDTGHSINSENAQGRRLTDLLFITQKDIMARAISTAVENQIIPGRTNPNTVPGSRILTEMNGYIITTSNETLYEIATGNQRTLSQPDTVAYLELSPNLTSVVIPINPNKNPERHYQVILKHWRSALPDGVSYANASSKRPKGVPHHLCFVSRVPLIGETGQISIESTFTETPDARRKLNLFHVELRKTENAYILTPTTTDTTTLYFKKIT